MRTLALAACAATLPLLLTACGTTYRDNDDPLPADAPVVRYSYIDSEDRSLAAEFADNYCEQAYGKDAVELDVDREPGGYEVTYTCR
jgi:hypothetical protein